MSGGCVAGSNGKPAWARTHTRSTGSAKPGTNPLETANALSIEGRFHHLAGRHGKAIELLERAADLVAPTAAADTVSTFAAPMISNVYAYLAGGYQHSGLFDDAIAGPAGL